MQRNRTGSSEQGGGGLGDAVRRYSDVILAALVISIIGMMIVPLPTWLLDLLLSLNITLAVVLLMVAVYVTDALRIAAFPTILLLTTLFRLGLNVSTTRLILSQADAGEVIEAFGAFVVAGNLVVGIVIFLILTMIQFIVIAKGSERVAEVAARFTLDAMPGKQMAIDADVRAGAIDQDEARVRRSQLERESQLYGSMDGAMKFVKGDAIAAILITAVNIVGGLIIGIGMRDLPAAEAAEVYTVLTIGDGLVSQIPALIISLAAGLIVTRVASEDDGAHLGHDIVTQVLAQPKAIAVAAVLLAVLALIPGLPTVPFMVLAVGAGALAYSLGVRGVATLPGGVASAQEPGRPRASRAPRREADEETFAPTGMVPIALELAPDVAAAVGAAEPNGPFLRETVPQIRRALYRDLGVVLPGIRVRQAAALGPGRFVIRLSELPMREGTLVLDCHLADEDPDRLAVLDVGAQPAEHPISGRRVSAIPAAAAAVVEQSGVATWSPAQVLAMQLAALLRRYAYELVGIQEAQSLLDELEKTHPALVSEVVPKVVSPQLLADVLRRLVEEQVSIRDLRAILQALAEWAPSETDAVILTEYVRTGLRRQITHEHAAHGRLAVWLVDPMIEDAIRGAIQKTATGSYLALDPEMSRDILDAFRRSLAELGPGAPRPIVLTAMEIRRYMRRLLEIELPEVTVLSFQELQPDVDLQPIGRIAVG